MIGLLLIIANIAGGILLGLATLDKWDGEKNYFNNIAGKLAPFQTIIGGILLGFGLLNVFKSGGLLFDIIQVLGGFLLLAHVIAKVPAIGDGLKKLSDKLMPFKAIVGIALLVIGVISIF